MSLSGNLSSLLHKVYKIRLKLKSHTNVLIPLVSLVDTTLKSTNSQTVMTFFR